MKIGVISDTHGSLTAWRKAYALLSDSDLIIHCGDVLYHGPRNPLPDGYSPAELAAELNSPARPLIFVRGNCDAEIDQMLLDYPQESPYAHVILPDYRILAHHGHLLDPAALPARVTRHYQIFISGHTHLPGIQRSGGIITLNPGSPSLPKNETKTPTVAVIEGRRIRIIELPDGKEMASLDF
jgi:putative phosphoesterase